MPTLPAGPYTLQFPQITAGFSHVLEVNCDVIGTPDPGDPPATVNLRTRDGAGGALDDLADAFWGAVRNLYGVETLCSVYTLFKRNPDNTERDFVSGGVLAVPNGGSGAYVPAGQVTLTYRSAAGSILKIVGIEPSYSNNVVTPIASSVNPAVGLVNTFIMGSSCFVMARDRSFPVAPMNVSGGQNEKIFNRRFRS